MSIEYEIFRDDSILFIPLNVFKELTKNNKKHEKFFCNCNWNVNYIFHSLRRPFIIRSIGGLTHSEVNHPFAKSLQPDLQKPNRTCPFGGQKSLPMA